MISQGLLFLTPLFPLMLAVLACFERFKKNAGILAVIAVLPALLLSLLHLGQLEATYLSMPAVLLGSVWHTHPTGMTFLLFTSVLWFFSALYGIGYQKADDEAQRFWILWLLTLSGNLGLLVSADIISFYGFFALMTFAGYGLVIHTGKELALRAGRVYLIMAVIGEMLILTALFLGSAATGHTSILAQDIAAAIPESNHLNLVMFCLFFGFGVKAGIPLMHLWLPLAHPVAPTPASAVLSGAMIKAGLFAWISLFPLGYLQSSAWGMLLILFGFVASFGGGLIGMLQQAPKAVLAYSSISQMGLMTVTIGCLFLKPELTPIVIPALAFFALHHALSKGALFLSVGINNQYQSIPIMLFVIGMLLPALSLVGIAGSGIQAKLLLKGGLYALYLPGIVTGITLSALATTGLMFRFLWLLRHERREAVQVTSGDQWMQLSWAGLLLCGFLAPVIFSGNLETQSILKQPFEYLGLLWVPVIASIFAFWFISHPLRASVPQGDIIVLIEPWFSVKEASAGAKETRTKPNLLVWADKDQQPTPSATLEIFSRSQVAALLGVLLLFANLLIWLY